MPPALGGAPGLLPSTAPGLIPPGVGGPGSSAKGVAGAQGANIICPRCGTSTPLGFAYCQQCGLHMQALQPTDPGDNPRPRAPSSPGAFGSGPSVPPMSAPVISPGLAINPHLPIDPQGATLASDGVRAGSISSPASSPAGLAMSTPAPIGSSPGGLAAPIVAPGASAAAWGTAILVNRDGSDGQRFSLAGEYSVIGRAGADIAFDEDRFLARQHARFERSADGVVKVLPLDVLNGVFRRADAPVELTDGMTILVGREVLRYEKIAAEETRVTPLIRHGVALFGSPPREPWGRFMQIVPSGGYRDVRHLAGEEIVLGREEGDIVFRDDAFMSRRHAAVTWNGKQAQVTDLGSSNGTFVRITGATVIKHRDHLRMGDQLLRIELGK